MGLFKSKHERQLDMIIQRLEMNMSNNYKDNAQANLRELETSYEDMKNKGVLKEKALIRYDRIISEYESQLKGYSHKDQKPYWT